MKYIKFLLTFLVNLLVQCSFIEARWYSHPPDEFRSYQKIDNIPSARIKLDRVTLEIWSKSNAYKTYTGPILIPFYPIEPPILNHENIYLQLAIYSGEDKSFKGKIETKNFLIKTNDNKEFFPKLITTYKANGEMHSNILEHYSEVPESIPVYENLLFDLNYMELRYSEIEWFEIRPEFILDGKIISPPVLRFVPKRDSRYFPAESPFFFPPVK